MERTPHLLTLAASLFVAAVLAGASFWPMSHLLLPGPLFVVWKTSGVALLALWAFVIARNGDGRLFAVVLAFGALGDAVLEMSQAGGGAAFLVGHVLAFILYRRHRRRDGQALALLIGFAIPVVAWLLTRDVGVTIYASGLGAMTGSAWGSRLPRHYVALGASLFAVSDLLIFSRFHVLHDSPVPGLLIWPLYFGGQALVAWGAARALAREPQ